LILMFVAGMEIDFESLRQAGGRTLIFPALTALGFLGVAAAIGIAWNLSVLDLLVVSASSVGMPLAVLQETGQIQRPLGRYVLLTASIGEFVSIMAITGYELFVEQGSAAERIGRLAKVVLLFGVATMMIRWARAFVWWRPQPFRRLLLHHDVAELGVRTGLLVMFAFVVIAETLGVEAILGAFIAGALVAFVLREKAVLESKIAALGHGLFIPIFFIVVGVRFDPRLLDFDAARDAVVLVGMAGAVKILSSLVFAPRALGLRDRLAAGSLLAAPLTLVVAIASIGRHLGVVSPAREASLVLLALLLSVAFPVVFRALAVAPTTAGD
jgi:Kef-type K+ transport system membrane component KefB